MVRRQLFQLRSSCGGDILITADDECLAECAVIGKHGRLGPWCQLELSEPRDVRPLGAECLAYTTRRLMDFLENQNPELCWVLSLAELHSSVYGEFCDGLAVIHIQDSHARFFAKLVLTVDDIAQWKRTLSEAIESIPCDWSALVT